MENRTSRRVLSAIVVLMAGCSGIGDDTYWRFTVAGQQYELNRIEFVVMALPDGRSFLALGPAAITATPGAAIQWRMPLGSVGELQGRELRFSNIMATEDGVNVIFTLTDDLSATPDLTSGLVLRIGQVDQDNIEGSFEGTGFVMVSMTEDQTSIVGVTGEFRARLQVQ